MNEKALNGLTRWYYGFSFFGLFASISMVVNFSRIKPAPHVFATSIIVCCAVVTLALSVFVFSAGKRVKRKQEYKKVIAATYIMALMIFPLSVIPAIYALKILKDPEVKDQFS
jgi:uncharacterized membrane protein YidH (DUF202 family)